MDNEVVQSVMVVLPTVGLAVVALVGLVLWVMGKRLARPACAVCGLVLGAMGGYVLARAMSDQGAMTLPLVIGAGIAGGLLAGLLFRVWVALSGAMLLALVAPAAVLVWQGTPAEPSEPTTTAQASAEGEAGSAEAGAADAADEDAEADGDGEAVALPESLADVFRRTLDGELELPGGEASAEGEPGDAAEPTAAQRGEAEEPTESAEVEQVIEAAADAAQQWYERQLALVGEWWAELGSGTRGTIYTTAAIGAGFGLVLGLLLPFVAASFETALVGSMLLLLAGRELAALHAAEAAGWFPQSPRMVIVWLGLITVLGFAIQWTLFRQQADR